MKTQIRGPWDNETDLVILPIGDYWIMIRRQQVLGHLCGYVGVQKGHPLYGVSYNSNDYDNPVSDLNVHGGVTWSDHFKNILPDVWWIGFDCGHFNDYSPYYPCNYNPGVYRDMEYVRNEVQNLLNQVEEYRCKSTGTNSTQLNPGNCLLTPPV